MRPMAYWLARAGHSARSTHSGALSRSLLNGGNTLLPRQAEPVCRRIYVGGCKVVCIVFRYSPAWKASRLDPIEGLGREQPVGWALPTFDDGGQSPPYGTRRRWWAMSCQWLSVPGRY